MKHSVALLCLAAALAAQSPTGSSQVIQTETREVLVDAIVTGKNGTYIGDLTAKDFHLSQDGKEQAIREITPIYEEHVKMFAPLGFVPGLSAEQIAAVARRGPKRSRREASLP